MTEVLVEKVRYELSRYEHPLFDFEARPAGDGVEVQIRFKPSGAQVHNYTFDLRPREIVVHMIDKMSFDSQHDYIIEMFTRNPQQAN